jgi:hypothetical protein
MLVLAATTAAAVAVPSSAGGAVDTPVAGWEMNEPSGATVMTDSSGYEINGSIGSAVRTGVSYEGATGYRWPFTKPNEPPAKPERLVTVGDSRLNPDSGDYAVTLRFRTTHSFGNMIQKGQAGTPGGYWKFQNVSGKVTCLFRGRADDGTVLSKAVNTGDIPLNDGAWHTLVCARTSDRLTLTIDGSRVRRALGPTGTISNTRPLTIGGKLDCDQIKVTCDYFAGEIDSVRIDK